MSLPTITLGNSPYDIKDRLRNNSTIYETNDEGDTIGHSAYDHSRGKFYYDDHGSCNHIASNTTRMEDCTVWYVEPKRYEFDTFLELAVFLAFVGKEWT